MREMNGEEDRSISKGQTHRALLRHVDEEGLELGAIGSH